MTSSCSKAISSITGKQPENNRLGGGLARPRAANRDGDKTHVWIEPPPSPWAPKFSLTHSLAVGLHYARPCCCCSCRRRVKITVGRYVPDAARCCAPPRSIRMRAPCAYEQPKFRTPQLYGRVWPRERRCPNEDHGSRGFLEAWSEEVRGLLLVLGDEGSSRQLWVRLMRLVRSWAR